MKYFTNSYKPTTEGFTTHYWERIAAIIVAEFEGSEFIYTPLEGVSHNYNNDPDFLKNKEVLMNLIDHYPINHDLEFQKQCKDSSQFFFNNVGDCVHSKSFAKIKELFYANKKRENYYSNDRKHIALHTRKCNPHDAVPPTELPNERFYRIAEQLRAVFSKEPLTFHLYSQGSSEQFKEFERHEDTVLHLNESIEDTFTAMAFADVLITCQSGFCRLAGYLSNGLVIYPREVATPLNLLPHFKLI